jgi:UMF1 family MFS transporter
MSETAVGDNKRAIAAWCLYDWGNSAFTTLVVTFVYATYFTRAFAPNELIGTTYWSYGIGVSAIIVALLSPVLGAIADRGGRRRRYLMISTVACVLATAALTFVKPGGERAILLALTIFVIANVAFEVGMVFYNAFLPSLVPQAKIGRVSGYGWGLGYVGGLVSMFLGLFAFVGFDPNPGWLGISTAEGLHARSTNLLVAGWFLVFSLPLFAFVREDRKPSERVEVRKALSGLKWTFHEIRRYREIAKFLLARLVYNDGLVTIFALGGVYAIGTFGFTLAEVMVFGIVINITAGLGALAFGFVDDRIGGKATVMVSLVALGVAVVAAMLAPTRAWLWVAAMAIGIFAGPNQSASRSLMGRFVPARKQSEFFGFFAFSGKFTSFLGPILFGTATSVFATQRAGVATVLVFFVVGGLLLLTVNERQGIDAAANS